MNSALLVLAGISLVAALTVSWARRPMAVFPVIVIVDLIRELSRSALTVQGTSIYPLDILAVSVTLAALFRILAMKAIPPAVWVWLGLLALLSVNVARGVVAFGLFTAVNLSREFFYLVSIALLVATLTNRKRALDSLRRSWAFGAVLAGGSALAYLVISGAGTFATSETSQRSLWSGPTLLLAQASLMVLLFPIAEHRSRYSSVLAFVGLLIVVLTQQRTVWAAAVIAILAVAMSRHSARSVASGASRRARIGVAAVAVAVVGLVVAGPDEIGRSLSLAIDEPTRRGSTLEFRIHGWSALSRSIRESSLADMILGQPTGTVVYGRFQGQLQAVIPHGMYVLSAFTLGLIGAAIFLGSLVVALVKLGHLKKTPIQRPGSGLLWMLLITQLVFMVGYSLSMSQGIIVGLATLMAFDRTLAARAVSRAGAPLREQRRLQVRRA